MQKRLTATLFALAFVSSGTVSPVCGEQNPQHPVAPKGYVLVDEETWHKLADEPGRHFERAREAYLKSDLRTSTTEVRKAGAHLRIAAAHATAGTKLALTQAEHKVEHLARQIEMGTVDSVDELDIVASRALHTLADYQYVRAAEAWRHHEERIAGQYLRAAGHNLEKATQRTGTMLREATAEVVRESRVLSNRMIEGGTFVMDEVGAGFELFGRQMERVGKSLNPTQTGQRELDISCRSAKRLTPGLPGAAPVPQALERYGFVIGTGHDTPALLIRTGQDLEPRGQVVTHRPRRQHIRRVRNVEI